METNAQVRMTDERMKELESSVLNAEPRDLAAHYPAVKDAANELLEALEAERETVKRLTRERDKAELWGAKEAIRRVKAEKVLDCLSAEPREADPSGIHYTYQNWWWCPVCEGESPKGGDASQVVHEPDCALLEWKKVKG
jgi:hypothetical protein